MFTSLSNLVMLIRVVYWFNQLVHWLFSFWDALIAWARRISESSTTDNQSVGFVTAVWKGNVKRRKFTVVHKWREFWRVFDHILFRFAYGYINLSCISDRSRETLSHLLSNLRKPSVAGKFFKMCLTSGRAFTFFVEGNALPKPFDWKLNMCIEVLNKKIQMQCKF